jgi:hypothetical protein
MNRIGRRTLLAMRVIACAASILTLANCRMDYEGDRAKVEGMCRQWIAEGVEKKSMSDCVSTTMQNDAMLNRRSITIGGGGYYPQASAVPASDAPVLQNSIPPTVRCQSMPAGLGTVQTVCR